MSSEQTFSTSDLRGTAQDYKRDAAHKHKWALGSVQRAGQAAGNPRPERPSETVYSMNRRRVKGAVASLEHGTKMARRHDMLEGTAVSSDDSADSADNEDISNAATPADAGVMYSFDAARGPSQGSQILNSALAKAVEKFEEKETVKLVKNEYEVLDSEGESLGLSPLKAKGKGKQKAMEAAVVVDGDDDYEFV